MSSFFGPQYVVHQSRITDLEAVAEQSVDRRAIKSVEQSS